MYKFIIVDWANNTCFNAMEFDSFEDAEEFLDEKLGDNYIDERQEYYIIEKICKAG